MNLTAAINRDYSFTATKKNVVGCENLYKAAESRKLDRLAAFFVLLGVPFMAGRAGKPNGLPVPYRVLTPVSVCHPSVRRGMAVIKTANKAHIMTAKSTRASAHSKSNVIFIDPRRQKEIDLKRSKLAFLKRINSISAAEAEVFNMIFDMNHGKTVCDVVKFSRPEQSK